jgi:hypothetical protein
MTSIKTLARISPAAWFLLPVALFAAWYVTLLSWPAGYGVAATGAATGTLPFIGAFVGGAAAWEGSRLRRGGVWGGPWPRSPLSVSVRATAAPVVAGWISFAAALLVALVTTRSFPPDFGMLAVAGIDVLAYAAVGFAIGISGPSALAIPIGILLPFLWLAFVPAMNPVWLRHLNGMFRDCCTLAESLSPRPVLASVALDVGFIAAAILLALSGISPSRRIFGVVAVLAIASSVGVASVAGMGYAPVVARDPAALECQSSQETSLCVWPEDATYAPQLQEWSGEVRAAWQAAALPLPPTAVFTEALGPHGPDVVAFRRPEPFTRDRTILAFADAIAPPIIDCPVISAESTAGLYLRGWLAAAGGVSMEGLAGIDSPGDGVNKSLIDTIRDLEAASSASRARWIESVTRASQTCNVDVPDLRVKP